MICPPKQLFESFLAGKLGPSESGTLATHAEDCTSCQALLDALSTTTISIRGLGALGKNGTSEPEPSSLFLARLSEDVPPPTCDASLPVKPMEYATAHAAGGTAQAWPALPGYEILAELGRGGMGIVLKARQLNLNRLVAVKMMLAGADADISERGRFRTEAEVAARLRHPNIVQIYEVGECQGRPFFSMELIEGPNLSDAYGGQPQPPVIAAELVEILARAIHTAHDQGIVHRDLKPGNILLQESGVRDQESSTEPQVPTDACLLTPDSWIPKITDFGLAKRLDDVKQTRHGLVMGTPTHMAPEQARVSTQALGPAVDIYSLGVILYELLTGRPPFMAETWAGTIARAAQEDPMPPRRLQPRCPRDLEIICLHCLEKEPAKRYTSALALAEDLERFRTHRPIGARPPALSDRVRKFVRRHKGLVAGAAGILFALAAGMIVSFGFAVEEAKQRKLAEDHANAEVVARNQALNEAYRGRLAAAYAALEGYDRTDAIRQLAAAPAVLRGWEWNYLHAALDQSLSSISVSPSLDGTAFCRPGQLTATLTQDKTIRVLDALTGDILRQSQAGPIASLFAQAGPTGSYLFYHEAAGHLFLEDQTGRRLQLERITGDGHICAVQLSPDGRRVVFVPSLGAMSSCTIWLKETATGRVVAQTQVGFTIQALAFHPDGQSIAFGGEDPFIYSWDLKNGQPRRLSDGRLDGKISSLAFSPDGTEIVSASDDQTIRQWSVETGRALAVRRGHLDSVHSVAYSPDGKWIASGGQDCTVRLWKREGGDAVQVFKGHTGAVYEVAFTADGERIVSRSADGTSRTWDASTSAPVILRDSANYVYSVAFSSDGTWFASAGWDQVVRLWDARSATPIGILKGPKCWIGSLAISRDGTRLIAAVKDSPGQPDTLWVWDTTTGKVVASSMAHAVWDFSHPHQLAISPDASRLLVGQDQLNELQFWDLTTARQQGKISMPVKSVRVMTFNADGSRLALAGENNVVYVLDAANFSVLQELHGHDQQVNSLQFSFDGARLVSASSDQTVRLWDVETGQSERILRGHTDEVFSAIFHPDGTRIVSAGRDRALRVWDVSGGDELLRLAGHANYVYCLAFSPDGSTLLSGSGDKTIRVWTTRPEAERVQARKDLEAAAEQAQRLVDQLFLTESDASRVVELIRADSNAGELLKRAAWHAVLRRLGNGPHQSVP